MRLHPLAPYRSHGAFISLLSMLVEAIRCSDQIMVQLIFGRRSSTFSRSASVSLQTSTWGDGGTWSGFSLQEFCMNVYLWGFTYKAWPCTSLKVWKYLNRR